LMSICCGGKRAGAAAPGRGPRIRDLSVERSSRLNRPGNESSNPSPSSRESRANLTSSITAVHWDSPREHLCPRLARFKFAPQRAACRAYHNDRPRRGEKPRAEGPGSVVPPSIVVVEREPDFETDLAMRHRAIFDMARDKAGRSSSRGIARDEAPPAARVKSLTGHARPRVTSRHGTKPMPDAAARL
jgi:hypothetical protein